jgi:hypothetical protein
MGRPFKNGIKKMSKEEKNLYNNSFMKNRHAILRLSILQQYSSLIPFCACCGEKEINFLCIDHINGGGNKHRKEISAHGKGGNIYNWLYKNNFPEGFQILCHNCNMAKGAYGICPHRKQEI